jgi:hypothetical protein
MVDSSSLPGGCLLDGVYSQWEHAVDDGCESGGGGSGEEAGMGVAKTYADPPIVGHPQSNGTQAGGDGSAPPPEAPVPAEVAASRWLYADKPLEYRPDDKEKDKEKDKDNDPLGFGAYADALAMLMDQKDTSTPLTPAINGPWGSGKTSLAKMAEARLSIGSDWDASHVICWFDAWDNDDAPHLGAAFAWRIPRVAPL